MWSTECQRTVDLPAEVLWETWIKVLPGEIELPQGDRYEPREPVGPGASITMTPEGQDSIEITVIRWEPPHVQADRASYGGVELTFTHSFTSAQEQGKSVVTTRCCHPPRRRRPRCRRCRTGDRSENRRGLSAGHRLARRGC